MHWWSAIFNICDYTRFITDMTAEAFGLYVGVIYIQKGIELLIYEFDDNSKQAGWLACFVAIAFSFTVYYTQRTGGKSWGPLWLRQGIDDWTFAAGCIFWTGFVHMYAVRHVVGQF